LLAHGWHLWDVGRRLGWTEFRSFINGLPPTGESAFYRARKPKSWWRTPEIDFLASILYTGQVANRQRADRGPWPKMVKLPEDHDPAVKTAEELAAKRKAQSEHIGRRRKTTKKKG